MIALSQRAAHLQGRLAAVIALLAAMSGGTPALGAAPQVRTQAPGFYRLMIGAVEITALSDGVDALPAGRLLTHVTAAAVDADLKRVFLSDPVDTSINAFLVNTGSKLVLIDAGAGRLLGPGLGHLLGNLQAAGYQPEQVDEIYLTHMHADHIGGLTAGGQAVFANAIVRAARKEAEYWLSPERMAAAPPEAQAGFRTAMDALAPYIKAGRFSAFDDGAALLPGIRALASHGHTAGHSSYVIESGGERLVVWGDLVHVGAVQLAHPAVTIRFDSEPAAAAAARARAFKDAAAGGWWVAAAHLPFPGIGHLRTERRGYGWLPANYSVPH